MINIKLFKLIGEYIIKEIKVLDQQLDYYNRLSEEEKWHIETGKKFNNLISEYPISEQVNMIISDLLGEMNLDENGNNVLIGGTENYENKWK